MKLKTKLILFLCSIAVIPTVIILSNLNKQTSELSEEASLQLQTQIKESLRNTTKDVLRMCKAQQEAVQLKVDSDLNVAREILEDHGEVSFENSLSWQAINQYTKEKTLITLPAMKIGNTSLPKNSSFSMKTPIIDEIFNLVGGTCTIFQRMNPKGDMLRIATNVKKLDGTRAIGTYIPAVNPDGKQNPVIKTVLSGKTFRGRAFVVNAWYITAYEPIIDNSGEIKGILYVGVKQENIKSLRTGITDINVGENGYVFTLGGTGNQKGVYQIAPTARQNGENILKTEFSDGSHPVKAIVEQAMEAKEGKVNFLSHLWNGKTTNLPEKHLTAFSYFPDWDWIVCVTALETDYQGIIRSMQSKFSHMKLRAIWLASIITLVAVILGFLFSSKLVKPMHQITRIAQAIARGEEVKELPCCNSDETGTLTNAMNQMIRSLQSKTELAGSIAEGYLPEKVELSSENDQLGIALQTMVNKLKSRAAIANEIADGILTSKIELKSEDDSFGIALSKMLDSLKQRVDLITAISEGNLEQNVVLNSDRDALGKALQQMISTLRDRADIISSIADGKLTQSVRVFSEADKLGKSLQIMIKNLSSIISSIQSNADNLASYSELMYNNSCKVADNTKKMREQSGSVAAASEQMSANISNIAHAATETSTTITTVSSTTTEMSTSISSVASAVEEMSASISEVVNLTKSGAETAARAMSMSKDATENMHTLGKAANEIGKVTEIIQSIAEQTNMLALNATIEAASAGDAGKGFAVVAGEVKELARQSADAAQNIAARIEGIQKDTSRAINTITEVSEIISSVNESVQIISRTSQEQSNATREIAQNIHQSNSGSEDIARSMSELSRGAQGMSANTNEAAGGTGEISRGIQLVHQSAMESNRNVNEMTESIKEVAKMAEEMHKLAQTFKL